MRKKKKKEAPSESQRLSGGGVSGEGELGGWRGGGRAWGGRLHLSHCAQGAGPQGGAQPRGSGRGRYKEEKLNGGRPECDSPEKLSHRVLARAINNFY